MTPRGGNYGYSQIGNENYSIGFWCFNPATSFSIVTKSCRSIILTSGTLYPFDSFKSELGINFQSVLEATHVINLQKQLFACIISQGKDRESYQITHKTNDSYTFQGMFVQRYFANNTDSLGNTLLEYCLSIPNGVLCFFPSYTLMDKVIARWNNTGFAAKLQKCKKVHIGIDALGTFLT